MGSNHTQGRMQMFKRFILLGLTTVTSSLFAAAPTTSTTNNTNNTMIPPSGVTLVAPASSDAWLFGISALYMSPSSPDYQYLPNNKVSQDPDWGGEIDATYNFAGESRDVTLSYTHINFDNSDTTDIPLTGSSVKAETDDEYNAADLVFGQVLFIANRLVLRPFAGLRFADLDITDSNNTLNLQNESHFVGLGPRAGLSAKVLTNTGFSFVGSMAGSLLVGNINSDLNFLPSTVGNISNDEGLNTVPELDARVAVDYIPPISTPDAAIGLQLGYQVVEYFNVANVDVLDSQFTNSVNSSSNFGYQGPYLRLHVSFL